jgi:hypothetical protein
MIVTYDIMQTIKPISANNRNVFGQYSQETEDYYLPKYLGRAFAYDVQENPANYTDLLDGVEFTDCDGNTIKFKGLKYVLAYLIYPEYLEKTKYRDTYTGMVTKVREEASTISQGQEEKLKNRYRRQAEDQVQVMNMYLNENTDTYTLWDCGVKSKAYTPIFTNVKKTKS